MYRIAKRKLLPATASFWKNRHACIGQHGAKAHTLLSRNSGPLLATHNESYYSLSMKSLLSTTAATTTENSNKTQQQEQKTSKDDSSNKNKTTSDIFLDNLGTIFLSTIGLIIAVLVRSSYGTSNRNKVRDQLQDAAFLDPIEIDDLRTANSELTPEIYRSIVQNIILEDDDKNAMMMTYPDFCQSVRTTMTRLKGPAFTVELGHLMDRVVYGAIMKQQQQDSLENNIVDENAHSLDQVKRPLLFFLTALSLALSSDATKRICILYEVLCQTTKSMPLNDMNQQEQQYPTLEQVIELVGYLQDTNQLAPDAQVVPTEDKIPHQKHTCGTPSQLVAMATGVEQKKDEQEQEELTVDRKTFASILQSQPVCAWGECYLKIKPPIS